MFSLVQCSFPRHRKLTISVCPSAGPPELFDAWLSHFCLEEKKGEISELLVGSPSIRALYTKMVRAQPAGPQLALSLGCWEVGGMCVVGDPVEPDGPCAEPGSCQEEADLPGFWQSEMVRSGKTSKVLWQFWSPFLAKLGPEGGFGWIKVG